MEMHTINYRVNESNASDAWIVELVNFQTWRFMQDGFKILYNAIYTKEIDGKTQHCHAITFCKI